MPWPGSRIQLAARLPTQAFLVFVVLHLLLNTARLPGQEVDNWANFELCGDCPLQLTEIIRLGDIDGPGIIESRYTRAKWSRDLGYLVFESGSDHIKVFDHSGRFRQSIGQAGEGPGEFSMVIDVAVISNEIVVLDLGKRAWSFFDKSGEFLDQRPYGFAAGRFYAVGGNRVVVVSMDRRPSTVGYPFHLVDLAIGVPSLHFGADASWAITEPYALSVGGSGTHSPGTVWWGRASSPSVQEWSVDNRLMRTIEGELPWFPQVTTRHNPRKEAPHTLLKSIVLDRNENLWMLITTADPGWKDIQLPPTGEPLVGRNQIDDYIDLRLDGFDLGARRHVGRYDWDFTGTILMTHAGEPAVSVVEYTEEMVPQLVIYRISWSREDLPR